MPYLSLKIPPGMVRPGTVYDARGRWYRGNLVRWFAGALQPIGGWRAVGSAGGPVRGMFSWRTNAGIPRLAFGTPDALKLYNGESVTDATPVDLVTGDDDVSAVTAAYSLGDYGAGEYGFGSSAVEMLNDAPSWSFDNFGEILIACFTSDRRVFKLATTDSVAVPLDNAPLANSVVVTPERMVVALGAGADARSIAWSDQENPTVWETTTLNTAGELLLSDSGRVMAGRRSRGETLIWTDAALWALRFIGQPLIYAVQQVGAQCGAVSAHSMAVVDNQAIWMSRRGFYRYNGYVESIPCEVADFIFSDMDRNRMSKIACVPNAEFNEVTWYYTSTAAEDNDSYVSLNLSDGSWSLGRLPRTAGVDRGVFSVPVMADPAGVVYEHETGASYEVGGTQLVPFVESGPIELGDGDRLMYARQLVPDEKTLGETRVMFYVASAPAGPESAHGPYSLARFTDVRFAGRQARLRIEQVAGGWRVGTPRLEVVPGGAR
jgi:hypothetical protein